MMLRKLKRRLNRILSRAGLLLLAACSQCNLPQPEPQEPTSTSTTGGAGIEQQCADACEFYRANECAEASDVCAPDGFDDAGECIRMITCAEACEADPAYYLARECE
jgi:hypothetical protein